MSKLTDFISQVRDGIAKTSHFTTVVVLPPSLLSKFSSSDITKLILFCDQTQIPGVSFSSNQVRSYGEFKEVPYEKLYEAVTLSFYVDSNMVIRNVFDEWVKLIQGNSRDFSWPKEYLSDLTSIVVENSQGDQTYVVNLRKCFPKAVSPVQLDYAGKEVMKLQVTLSYQYAEFERVQVGSKSPNLGENLAIDQTMEEYKYGFQSFATIPTEYFQDFTQFQKKFIDYDLSFGGAKTIEAFEDIGVRTGFGGIFI